MKIILLSCIIILQAIFIVIQFAGLKWNFANLSNRSIPSTDPCEHCDTTKISTSTKKTTKKLINHIDRSYNNKEATVYLEKSRKTNDPYFKRCVSDNAIEAYKVVDVAYILDVNDEKYADLLKIGDTVNSKNTFYMITINLDYVRNRFQADPTLLYCSIKNFDKKLDSKESVQKIGKKIRLDSKNKFTVLTDKYGFYEIKCRKVKRVTRQKGWSKFIFKGVFVVYPKNMNELIQKTNPNFEKVEIMRNKITDSEKNPILRDGLFKGCDEPLKQNYTGTKMNVLIIGFDSVSVSHFKRIFPKTYNFLTTLEKNIFFENYKKIGENTYPNMVPFLSNVIVEESIDLNTKREIRKFKSFDTTYHDLLPFIWTKYQLNGYLTMFNEENPEFGTFTYLKNGFRYSPTHFYTTPFFKKYAKTMTSTLCSYNNPTYRTSLNIIESFVTHMNKPENKNLPYFSFNFLKYYTHNYFTIPASFDDEFERLIKYFEKNGYLDNTLLVLMSDHGSRLSEYSYKSSVGKMERSMPFFSMRLPKALWNTDYQKNGEENKNKLFTVFDINKTLKQFHYLNKYGINSHVESKTCRENFQVHVPKIRYKRGISLFERLPSQRSCDDALIKTIYCTSIEKRIVLEDQFKLETRQSLLDAAKVITENIVKMTDEVRIYCEQFKFKEIVSVQKLLQTNLHLYEFQVVLQPADALFEAYVMLKNEELTYYGKAIRLNIYGNQSICLDDASLHGFCYCKSKSFVKIKL